MFSIDGHPTMARARTVNSCVRYLRPHIMQNPSDAAAALGWLRHGASLTFATWNVDGSKIVVTRIG